MSASQDDTVWMQLTESAIGRLGGALIERTKRAAGDSRLVGGVKRANAAWSGLAPAITYRAVGTFTLAAAATHVAMMLPQHPPGAWWLILPSLAGAFGITLVALSFLAPPAGVSG